MFQLSPTSWLKQKLAAFYLHPTIACIDMTTVAFRTDQSVHRESSAWQAFVIAISIATFTPFVVAPLTENVIPQGTPGYLIFIALFYLGSHFHVATTGWFFTDPEIRAHFRNHPVRYLFAPAILICGAVAISFNSTAFVFLFLIFTGWQFWHYQKQNVGLLSFIAAGTASGPLSKWERYTVMLAWLPVVFSVTKMDLLPFHFTQTDVTIINIFGLTVYTLVAGCFVAAILNVPGLRRNFVRLLFFTGSVVFFLPLYIFSNPIAATTGFASAHGLQYLVFMAIVGIDRRQLARTLLVMLSIAVPGSLLLVELISNGQGGWLGSLFIGLVMSHFVIDAGIWRLREPFQRAYMRRKFAFIFER